MALRRLETGSHKSGDTQYNTVLRMELVSGSVDNCRANGRLIGQPLFEGRCRNTYVEDKTDNSVFRNANYNTNANVTTIYLQNF